MKKLFVTLQFALFTLILIGCGSSNPMVGTWKLQMDEAMTKSMPANMKPDVNVEFKADNTFAIKMKIGDRNDDMEGTYKLDGKTLVMTQTKEGGKPSTDKPATATLSEDMKSFDMPGGMGKVVKQ